MGVDTPLGKYLEENYDLIPVTDLKIQLSESIRTGYDFTVTPYYNFCTHDGVFVQDTMTVFVPMSKEAQDEVRTKMITSTGHLHMNEPNFEITKEMLTGILTITWRVNEKQKPIPIRDIGEARDLDPYSLVLLPYPFKGMKEFSAGRLMFNTTLPNWYPFVNAPVDRKVLNEIFLDIIGRNKREYVETVDSIVRLSNYYNTKFPKSFSIDMLELPKHLLDLKKELLKAKSVTEQMKIIDQMEKDLLQYLKEKVPDLYLQIASGAAKGGSQIRQIMVAKGLISDPKGNILPPIANSIADGFDPKEYFDASAGSRKGIASRALSTAAGGYLGRKFIYVMGDVLLNTENRDCLTKRGLRIKLTPQLFKKLQGRNIIDSRGRVVPIDKSYVNSIVELRSPIYCKTKKICPTCYGELYKQINTRNIGILSAGSMNFSERIMKCQLGLVKTKYEGLKTFDDIFDNTQWEDP